MARGWPRVITRGRLKGRRFESEAEYRREYYKAIGGKSRHERRNEKAKELGYKNYYERRKTLKRITVPEEWYLNAKRNHGQKVADILDREYAMFTSSSTEERIQRVRNDLPSRGDRNAVWSHLYSVIKG